MRSEREQAYAFIPALFPLRCEMLTSRQILCLNPESDFLTLILHGFLQQTGQTDLFFWGGGRGKGMLFLLSLYLKLCLFIVSISTNSETACVKEEVDGCF